MSVYFGSLSFLILGHQYRSCKNCFIVSPAKAPAAPFLECLGRSVNSPCYLELSMDPAPIEKVTTPPLGRESSYCLLQLLLLEEIKAKNPPTPAIWRLGSRSWAPWTPYLLLLPYSAGPTGPRSASASGICAVCPGSLPGVPGTPTPPSSSCFSPLHPLLQSAALFLLPSVSPMS